MDKNVHIVVQAKIIVNSKFVELIFRCKEFRDERVDIAPNCESK